MEQLPKDFPLTLDEIRAAFSATSFLSDAWGEERGNGQVYL